MRQARDAFGRWWSESFSQARVAEGMPRLEPAQLDLLPKLKAVFYAAGSVRDFAGPMLERDITVVSAWATNAA